MSDPREMRAAAGGDDRRAGQVAVVRRVTWIGLCANLLLAGFKFAAGVLGNSAAVVADAVHSLSDGVTDVAVLVGTCFWCRPPDEAHPYGHQRIEILVTVFIGLMLAVAAVGLGYDAVVGLAGTREDPPRTVALIAALTSLVVKETLYHYTRAAGRKVRSSALTANAWHHRTDALSSIPVAAAVGLALFDPALSFLDHVGALLVALLVLLAAWKIAAPALDKLVDRGAPAADLAAIRRIATAVPGVREIHGVRTRFSGGGLLVDLHVLVQGDLSVRDGHAVADEVKRALLDHGPDIEDAVIHIEPCEEERRLPPGSAGPA